MDVATTNPPTPPLSNILNCEGTCMSTAKPSSRKQRCGHIRRQTCMLSRTSGVRCLPWGVPSTDWTRTGKRHSNMAARTKKEVFVVKQHIFQVANNSVLRHRQAWNGQNTIIRLNKKQQTCAVSTALFVQIICQHALMNGRERNTCKISIVWPRPTSESN